MKYTLTYMNIAVKSEPESGAWLDVEVLLVGAGMERGLGWWGEV